MIPTPEYAVNPRGWNEASSFDEEDGIPIEKGSGFGNHIKRDVVKRSIVKEYIEVAVDTFVDVSERYSDLFIRVTGEEVTVTVSGSLPPGNSLSVDPLGYECSVVLGGNTYELAGNRGVVTFFATTAGWNRPSVTHWNIEAKNDLSFDGQLFPGFNWDETVVSMSPGDMIAIPRGAWVIATNSVNPVLEIWVPFLPGWIDVLTATAIIGLYCSILANGTNYRLQLSSGASGGGSVVMLQQ